MEQKFNYVIVDENNNWRSTAQNATQSELDEEIETLKEIDAELYGFELELVVFKYYEKFTV
jgi:hypothetical protein